MPGLEGTSLGRYRLIRRLGRGGMAEVYLVNDERMHRSVAMKIVRSNETEFSERFARETEAMANFHHDHILPAYDYGEQEPWHYLVMPYMEQGTLSDLLKDGPLSLEHAGELLQQLASGLQYAHEHGLIHRDIKPSNILLRDKHYVYLADFGLARTLEGSSDLTQTGTLLGTPEYMAPELADGPAGMSSDIYSLAVVLYQMITGRPPFQGNSAVSVFWKHLRDQAQPPSQINSTLPHSIDRVLMRALAKNPDQRYATPLALSQAYQDALHAPDDMPSLYDSDVMEEIQPRPDLVDSPATPVLTPLTSRQTPPVERGKLILRGDPTVQTPPGIQQSPISQTATGRNTFEQFPEAPPLRSRQAPQRPPQRSNRAIIGLLIGVIFLFLLILTGLLAILVARTHSSGTVTPTPMVQTSTAVTSTTQPTPSPQLTETAVASTATAQTQATPGTASATAEAITGTTPVLSDPLNAPDATTWPNNGSCTFENNSYHVLINTPSVLQPCIAGNLTYNDAAIQIDVTLNSGDSAGLVFRASSFTVTDSQFYDFEITNQGAYYFRYRANGMYTSLIPDTATSAIKAGKNTLLVIASRNDFKFFINQIFVSEINNGVFAEGEIGVAAGTLQTSSHADASFANLKIYQVA